MHRSLRHKFRFRYLIIQELHQPLVRKRIQIPGRRQKVRLHRNRSRIVGQVHMMSRNFHVKFPLRLGVLFLVRHLVAGYRRSVLFQQIHAVQKFHDRIPPATNPDVDVPALPHEPVRVQARIRRPLQDGSPPPLARKQLREPPSLVVHQAVVPANRLRLARPLEGEVQRRPPVLREFADSRIRDAHNSQPGCQGIHFLPIVLRNINI